MMRHICSVFVIYSIAGLERPLMRQYAFGLSLPSFQIVLLSVDLNAK